MHTSDFQDNQGEMIKYSYKKIALSLLLQVREEVVNLTDYPRLASRAVGGLQFVISTHREKLNASQVAERVKAHSVCLVVMVRLQQKLRKTANLF